MFREPSSFTELNYYRSLFWTGCFTLWLRNAATFYLKAQSQNGVILKVTKMLTWLRGVTFDKLQLSVSLQLMQHFNKNLWLWTSCLTEAIISIRMRKFLIYQMAFIWETKNGFIKKMFGLHYRQKTILNVSKELLKFSDESVSGGTAVMCFSYCDCLRKWIHIVCTRTFFENVVLRNKRTGKQ